MDDTQRVAPKIQQSFARFDARGCLLDWDESFTSEFVAASALLKVGTSFRDILRCVYENDPTAAAKVPGDAEFDRLESRIAKRIERFGASQTFDYRYETGEVMQVQEIATGSRRYLSICTRCHRRAPSATAG